MESKKFRRCFDKKWGKTMSNKKKILILDPEKCSGCKCCQLACSFNKVQMFSPVRSRIQLVKVYEYGISIPVICQHCADPICIDVCPTKAISKDEELGIIKLDEDKCIGCRTCFMACPVGAIQINVDTKKMIKCDLCEGDPECVKACTYGALEYVDIDAASSQKRKESMKKISEVYEKIIS